MAADSAIIVLIDIFRLLVRSGVLATLPSTQTPAASDHSINHEPPAMDQGRQPCNDFKGAVHRSKGGPLMSALGLGCAKAPALAPHVEISLSNCISESQIILHTRGWMPCWRIVFSTFRGCNEFLHSQGQERTSPVI